MKKKICVPDVMAERLCSFLNKEGISLEVVTNASCDVTVVSSDERIQCDLNTIYSGGWIVCETARQLARKIEISIKQIGKLLNFLNIKVRRCSLGCFQ